MNQAYRVRVVVMYLMTMMMTVVAKVIQIQPGNQGVGRHRAIEVDSRGGVATLVEMTLWIRESGLVKQKMYLYPHSQKIQDQFPTAMNCFFEFFSEDLIEKIIVEMNRYAKLCLESRRSDDDD